MVDKKKSWFKWATCDYDPVVLGCGLTPIGIAIIDVKLYGAFNGSNFFTTASVAIFLMVLARMVYRG